MGHPLKIWRDTKKLTQPEAAKALGVDAMTVSRWERGEHLPHRKHWQKIQDETGIGPGALLEHVKQSEPASAA